MNREVRVAILGLDAGDHILIERWAAEGHLPHFARLMREGVYGPLESTASVFSGTPWLSIATGCGPAKSGVYTRHQLESGTYNVRRIRGRDSRKPPFWASFRGPLGIVDVPKAPLLPEIDGIQLVEWGAYDHYSQFSSIPAGLSGGVLDEFGTHPFVESNFEEALHHRRDFDVLRPLLIDAVRLKHALNLGLVRKYQPRLYFSVFGETHAAGHAFWRFQDGRHPAYDPENPYAGALRDVYGAVDAAVGEFAEAFGRDYLIMVVSGHGFTMDNLAGDLLQEVLVRTGFTVPRLKSTAYAAYAPSLTLDMSRSRAFCLPTDWQGFIRINLRGREPGGIVDDLEYRAVCDEIADELLALRHRISDAPVVRDVVRVRDMFPGEYAEALPDLSVLWNSEHVAADVVSPGCGPIHRAPDLTGGSGNHRGEGFLLVHGAGSGSGTIKGSTFDIAPIVCRLLGETAGAEWDGKDTLWTIASSRA